MGIVQTSQFQQHVTPPTIEREKVERTSKVLSVQSTHGQPKPEPGNGTQARLDALARYLAKKVDITRATCTDMLLRGIWSTAIITRVSVPAAAAAESVGGIPTGGSERVREDTINVAR